MEDKKIRGYSDGYSDGFSDGFNAIVIFMDFAWTIYMDSCGDRHRSPTLASEGKSEKVWP